MARVTVYYGRTSGAMDYFADLGLECPAFTNPADFLLDILEEEEFMKEDEEGEEDIEGVSHRRIARSLYEDEEKGGLLENVDIPMSTPIAGISASSTEFTGERLVEAFKTSEANHRLQQLAEATTTTSTTPTTITQHSSRKTSLWQQIEILTHRTWLSTTRDSKIMYVRTGAAIGIALLVGGIFFQQPDTHDSSGNRYNTTPPPSPPQALYLHLSQNQHASLPHVCILPLLSPGDQQNHRDPLVVPARASSR